jgi:hypothetical protein
LAKIPLSRKAKPIFPPKSAPNGFFNDISRLFHTAASINQRCRPTSLLKVSLYKPAAGVYIPPMRTINILSAAALLFLAAVATASASDIVIARSDLSHFVGTYDARTNTLTDYTIADWDEDDPMAYQNAIDQFPGGRGVYYGLAPWYTSLAQAVLDFPPDSLTFVSLVDVKLSYAAQAIVTKWKNLGDSLEFVCVTTGFPDLGGAPNLDGCYLLPDSSHFMIVRSAGGNMESIWQKFSFILENPPCHWEQFYHVDSDRRLLEPEFTESYCRLVDSAEAGHYVTVISQAYKAKGPKRSDGSYEHELVSTDSTVVDLWKLAQKAPGDQ